MKIVILTKPNISNYFIVNYLAKKYNCSVIAEKNNNLKFALRKLRIFTRKKGFIIGLFAWLKMILEYPYIHRQQEKTKKYLEKKLKTNNYNCHTIKVNNINNLKIIKIIRKIKPKVIIVIGTGIIKKEIISAFKKTKAIIVNWHAGIIPEYRGCQSEFWAILNNDWNKIGSTIHYLDEGIDTGKIILQEKILLEPKEKKFKGNFRFLRYKNILLSTKLLENFLKMVEKGKIKSFIKKNTPAHIFSTPRKKDYEEYYKNKI